MSDYDLPLHKLREQYRLLAAAYDRATADIRELSSAVAEAELSVSKWERRYAALAEEHRKCHEALQEEKNTVSWLRSTLESASAALLSSRTESS